jgi:integrase
MGRPPLPVGTWGSITVVGSPGRWRARARFRDFDGETRQVERVGATKGAARAALTAYLSERTAPSGDAITAESRLSEVAEVWFAERSDLSTNTVRRYRDALEDHILAGVGNLQVREATVSRLDRFIKSVTENTGAPTAKLCASVLSGVMGLAVRHGAARANPMRDVAGVTVTRKDPRALTMDEVRALRAAIHTWQTTPKRGRPPTGDLLDVVDLFLATGARIGEVLALRWSDVDLDDGTITIAGTIVMTDSKPSRPGRQGFPKGKKPRVMMLPRFAVDGLLRRRVTMTFANVNDAVFPSTAGTWRDPGNVRKQLAKVLPDAGLEWVTPHTFRRTVATVIANEDTLRNAADQLGHGDDAVTRRHYWDRPDRAVDSRTVLDRFAPDASSES